ncbi:very large low complexity [Cryptosporidium sp. chipmunk genotype I]|uniref:very large low complexity n=1 Tax=Cryptosporidium sp. chipmunk genotype I TaxID=1280935 RepID=UPI00351A7038|nr:very large low complexity [Cryptosporidium sp. chipmunk genotype I]
MFEKTTDYKDYFPEFIDDDVKRRETREAIEEILELLKNDQLFTISMIQSLARLIKQLNQFEDLVFIRFVKRSERINIIQNIWDIIKNEKVSTSTKIRFANILASHINCYKKLYLRPWWHSEFVSQIDLENNTGEAGFNCNCQDEVLVKQGRNKDGNCICGLIDFEYIINKIEEEFTRDYLDGLTTNSQKIRNYVSSLSRVLNAYRPYIGEVELEGFLNKWLSLNTSSFSFFVYSKLFVLICSPYCSYKLLSSGRIFEIWEILNGQLIGHWDSVMIALISRGVRYSWKIGKSLDALYKRIPYLFEVLYINLGIPILHNVVSNSINTGATSSNSSVSSGTSNFQVLQTKAPSIIKEIISSELLSALTIKPANIFNKFAIIFIHLIKSLNCLHDVESQKTPDCNQEIAEHVKAIPNSLINLVNVVFPLNHPSNIGKWSHGISIFVQALTYQYCKRIYRERVFIKSEKMSQIEKECIQKVRLCRFDDEYLMTILFPLMEQGIYSKDIQVAGRYEDSLKRWTYILPDILLSFLLNIKIMPALEGNTETHQVYIAFRILATIVPLVIQFTPQELPKFLQVSLQGIDISDPMKINQTLFFLTVLFYNLQNYQVETLEFDEYETIENLSLSMENKYGDIENLKSYYSLYNYPKDIIPLSDKSLQNRKEVPKVILDQTDINGQSPLNFYFQNNMEGDFEFFLDEDIKKNFYFILNGKFDRETLLEKFEQRKLLIDSIFGYWILEFLERVLNLLENVVKPSETGSYSSSVDLGISYALRALIISIFSKCKQLGYNQLLRDCYEMIGNWISNNYIPDNYKHLSKILSAMGSCDPELSFELILSKLLLKVKAGSEYTRMISNNISFLKEDSGLIKFINNRSSLEFEDESFILYYINLVSSLIRYTQDHLLKKENRVYYFGMYSLIVELLSDSRKKIKRAGLKLQQRFVESLIHIQIVESKDSSLLPLVKNPETIAKGIILWGLPFYLQEKSVFNHVQKPIWFIPQRKCLLEVKSLIIFNYLFIIKLLKKIIQVDSNSSELFNLLDNLFQEYLQIFKNSINNFFSEDEVLQGQDNITNFQILLNIIQSCDGKYKQSNTCDLMGTVSFCLNNIRVLNKSVSYILPIARKESSIFQRKAKSENNDLIKDHDQQLLLTLNQESYKEFEPFFSKYYSDTYRLILFLVQIFSGIQMLEVKNLEIQIQQEDAMVDDFLDHSNSGNLQLSTSTYYRLSDPLVNITNTEEIRFKSKVIKTINQCLNHYYSSSSNLSLSSLYNIDFSESVLAWLSYTNGLYHQSSLLNSPKIFWLKNIQYYWNKRINMRRHEYGFFGYRKKLIYLITLFSLGNYNLIRKAAQSALKESINSHISSRNSVFQFILFEVYFSIFIFNKYHQLLGDFGSEATKNQIQNANNDDSDFEAILRSNINYVKLAFASSSDNNLSTMEEFLFNHLSGLSYIIVNNSTYHRFLWNNLDLLIEFINIISYSSSYKLSKENIPVRLLNAFNCIISNRDFNNLLFQYLVNKSGQISQKTEKYRSSLEIKLNKLISLFSQSNNIEQNDLDLISKINSNYLNSENYNANYIINVIRILLSNLNKMRNELLINNSLLRRSLITLTFVQGVLTILISQIKQEQSENELDSIRKVISYYWSYLWDLFLDTDKSNNASFYSVIFFNLTTLIKQLYENDRSFLVELIMKESDFMVHDYKIRNLLENMVNITVYRHQISNNHPNSSSQTSLMTSRSERKIMNSTNASIVTNNLILNYTSIINSFPYHRFKCYSNNLSIISIIFFQLLLFMIKIKSQDKDLNFSNNKIELIIEILQEWCNNSMINLEKEKHLLILEILAAIFSISTISKDMDDFIFDQSNLNRKKLVKILYHEFQQSDQDFIFNYMDFIKHSLTPVIRQNLNYYYYSENGLFGISLINKSQKKKQLENELLSYFSSFNPNMIDNNSTLNILLNFILNPFKYSKMVEEDKILDSNNQGNTEMIMIIEDNNDLSTFEMIKYLRIYQSGLMELIMNNDNNNLQIPKKLEVYLKSGLKIFNLIFQKDNNYKQLREEMSNMLHSLIIASNLIYSQYKYELKQSLRNSLIQDFKLMVLKLNNEMDNFTLLNLKKIVDSKNKKEEKMIDNDNKNNHFDSNIISNSEVILYYCLLRDLYSNKRSELKIEELISFSDLFNLINKLQMIISGNNDDILGLSYGSLMSLLITQLNHDEVPIMIRLDNIVNNMEGLDLNNYKNRLFKIRVNTIIGEFYSPLLNGTKLELDIINNIIYGLFEDQSEIKYISKLALCTLFRALNNSRCINYIKLFKLWINRMEKLGNNNSNLEEINILNLVNFNNLENIFSSMEDKSQFQAENNIAKNNERYCRAGVLGLISTILSHPYDIPFWLPDAITFLANYSGMYTRIL